MPRYRYVGDVEIYCPDAGRGPDQPIQPDEEFDCEAELVNPVFVLAAIKKAGTEAKKEATE